jgi:predicted outer membrane repeat protein
VFSGNTATTLGGGLYLYSTKSGDINTTLTGCTFLNNSAFVAGGLQARGGGLTAYALGAGSTIAVAINGGTFTNNTAEQAAGGLYNYARTSGVSQITINGTAFSGNQSYSGGAVYNYSQGGTANIDVTNGSFNQNTVSYFGGALFNYCEFNGGVGNIQLTGCTFTENQSAGLGGALANTSIKGAVANLTVARCRFEQNSATQHGGAVYAKSSTRSASYPGTSTVTNVQNSVFFANTAGERGGSFYSEALSGAPSTLQATNNSFANNTSLTGAVLFNAATGAPGAQATFANNVLWNNLCTDTTSRNFHNIGSGASVSVGNSSLQNATFTANEVGTGTFNNLGGNLGGDPLFVNLGLGDLHLQSNSPCVDAGTSVALTVDFDGSARPQGTGFDMGAYETSGARPQARQSLTAQTPLNAQLYPNPTTGTFSVAFDREVTGFAQVFDLQGRLVASAQLNGTNVVQFDLGAASSGLYLVRLVNGAEVATEQVVLQKP